MSRRRRSAYQENSFGAWLVGGVFFTSIVVYTAAPQIEQRLTGSTAMLDREAEKARQQEAIERSVYYRNCNDARAAGAAPIYRGSPGYRSEMDGDSDGIACEPYY